MKITLTNVVSLKSINRIALLGIAALVLLAGCSRGAEAIPQPTDTPAPEPFDVTYCDIDTAEICLEGFGVDVEERLLILFKAIDEVYTNIYIRADGPEGETLFECQQSDDFSENVYCLGEIFHDGELIKMNIYSKSDNKLLAIGVFNVHYGELPESGIVFQQDATTTPSSITTVTASPVPTLSTPSYPNPSYPNPDTTP